MKKLIFVTLFIFAIAGIIAWITSIVLGFEGSVKYTIYFLCADDITDKIYKHITIAEFKGIQILLGIWIILLSLIVFYYNIIYSYLRHYVSYLIQAFHKAVKDIYATPLGLALILPSSIVFYCMCCMPISSDEASTYLNYSSRGFWVALSFYPVPNNHVLFSILSALSLKLPLLPELFKLRLVAVISNFAGLIILFRALQKYYSVKFALLVTGITASLFYIIMYGYLARGYSLYFLFFSVCLYAYLNLKSDNASKTNWITLSIAFVMGTFAIPSFIYAIVLFNILILMLDVRHFKNLLVVNIISGLAILLLYAPIITLNGLEAIANNGFVRPINREMVLNALPSFLFHAVEEITGVPSIFVLALICISLGILILRKEHAEIKMALIYVMFPALILVVHSVVPFERTFIFYGFICVYLILLPWAHKLGSAKLKTIGFLTILIQIGLCINAYNKINASQQYAVSAKSITEQVKGPYRYYCNEDPFYEILNYTLKSEKVPGSYVVYGENKKTNADTLNTFDYVIINNSMDETVHKKYALKTADYTLYTKE